MNTIQIGSDHAGYELKEKLKSLFSDSITWIDHGAHSIDSVDYPDYAHPVAKAVLDSNGIGILICGSANGVAMTANKYAGIRAAICWTEEIAQLARQHNNANILCIPARFVSEDQAVRIVKAFLNTEFEGGRHENRVNKIACV
jgi:ribose 5-phosphate isomerase B